MFILGSSLVGAAPASAQDTTVTTLMVFVVDHAGVLPDVLEQANQETTRIFRGGNVELIWLRGGDPRFKDVSVLRSVITIHILSREMTDQAKKPESVMGWATLGTRIVKVSYFVIQAALSETSPARRDIACILGHVVAHEIGHLLLPSGAHSRAGIMQERMDRRLAAVGGLFFTASQAQDIRTKLAKR
jgi:hypothetical protein